MKRIARRDARASRQRCTSRSWRRKCCRPYLKKSILVLGRKRTWWRRRVGMKDRSGTARSWRDRRLVIDGGVQSRAKRIGGVEVAWRRESGERGDAIDFFFLSGFCLAKRKGTWIFGKWEFYHLQNVIYVYSNKNVDLGNAVWRPKRRFDLQTVSPNRPFVYDYCYIIEI